MDNVDCDLCGEDIEYCDCLRCLNCEELQLSANVTDDGKCSLCGFPSAWDLDD